MMEDRELALRCEVDESPLKQAMDRNKESLQVKLMLRRPYNQLVDQGIMPSLKTAPFLHEQAKQQERRKTGDLLKAKIQQRPKREELVRQHILEDVGYIDPSLAERQRMLKKARLADQLNDQLSHRPGPLELIQKNILHTEEPIERAIKEGHILFKATCEGHLTKPQHPDHYISFEDESQGSKTETTCYLSGEPILSIAPLSAKNIFGKSTKSTTIDIKNLPDNNFESLKASGSLTIPLCKLEAEDDSTGVLSEYENCRKNLQESPINTENQDTKVLEVQNDVSLHGTEARTYENPFKNKDRKTALKDNSEHSLSTAEEIVTLDPTFVSKSVILTETTKQRQLSNVTSAATSTSPTATELKSQSRIVASTLDHQSKCDAPGKEKNKKKSKSKSQPKTRTIKFHEYKGPSNIQRFGASLSTSSTAKHGETSYELLLQQQQLFLQWQVEFKNKYPQLILPATSKSKPFKSQEAADDNVNITSLLVSNSADSVEPNLGTDQPPLRPLGKLEDMKVSDLKVELKRRCLPVSGSKPQLIERLKPFTEIPKTNRSHLNDHHIMQRCSTPENSIYSATENVCSGKDSIVEKKEPNSIFNNDLSHLREEEDSSAASAALSGNFLKYRKKIVELHHEINKIQSQKHLQIQPLRSEKLALQQHLQNRLQQQHLNRQLHQLQQLQLQQNQQLVIQQLNNKANLAAILQSQSTNMTIFDTTTLTAINNKKNQSKKSNSTTAVQVPTSIVLNLAKPTKINGSILGGIVSQTQNHQLSNGSEDNKLSLKYDDGAKLLKVKIDPLQKNSIKSQMVDDVLEILISSGELPPSAAQEPVTPSAPNNQLSRDTVFTVDAESPTQSSVFVSASSPMEVSQNDLESTILQSKQTLSPLLFHSSSTVELRNKLIQHQEQKKRNFMNFTAKISNYENDYKTKILLSSQSMQISSSDSQPKHEVTSFCSNNLDIKDLDLDLETMDFSQLDYDFGPKMGIHQEFIDIDVMPMDMDEPDWVGSLMSESETCSVTTTLTTSTSESEKKKFLSSKTNNDHFDPLLANNQDHYNLFNIDDSDFKISSDLSSSWNNEETAFQT